jgi:hypothetical protein
VPAHKYVLATGSTVFYAMLYGGLADDSVDEISGKLTKNTLSVLAEKSSCVLYLTE